MICVQFYCLHPCPPKEIDLWITPEMEKNCHILWYFRIFFLITVGPGRSTFASKQRFLAPEKAFPFLLWKLCRTNRPFRKVCRGGASEITRCIAGHSGQSSSRPHTTFLPSKCSLRGREIPLFQHKSRLVKYYILAIDIWSFSSSDMSWDVFVVESSTVGKVQRWSLFLQFEFGVFQGLGISQKGVYIVIEHLMTCTFKPTAKSTWKPSWKTRSLPSMASLNGAKMAGHGANLSFWGGYVMASHDIHRLLTYDIYDCPGNLGP